MHTGMAWSEQRCGRESRITWTLFLFGRPPEGEVLRLFIVSIVAGKSPAGLVVAKYIM